MSVPFPSPTIPADSRSEVFSRYLEFFRDRLVARVRALPAEELRRSRLPSGWTPLELVKHLTYVERRWLVWGFEGEPVADPWGDSRDGRWHVGPEETRDSLLDGLAAQAARSQAVIDAHDLDQAGRPGERWDGAPPATLERVLFHLVQEYARHLGHLDIVCELAGGDTGE
jgi:uncharacterized damage-inducible protein DinB